MAEPSLRAALITTDPRFRDQVQELLSDPESGFALGLEIAVPFAQFGEEQVSALRQLSPDLVFIDVQEDPELGVKFTQFLTEMNPGQRVIAAGSGLSHDLLLAAMRAGISDFLAKPVTSEALLEAFQRVSLLYGRSAARLRRPGQVFAFFSPKGGSGCTTISTNVAVMLHRLTGKRTLLVDLDLELGEAALLLGIQPRYSFVDLVQNFHRMDAGLLASYVEQHGSGVQLLSAPLRLSDNFHSENGGAVTGDDTRQILQFLRSHYEYIVVDTSRAFSAVTLGAFDQADFLFLVTNVDLPSLRNVQRALPMLKRMLPQGEQQIRLVVNRYNSGNDISLDDIERSLGLKVYCTVTNDYQAVIQSLNEGKPLVLDGKSKSGKDIKMLGAELAGIGTKRKGRRGAMMSHLVSRLWRRSRPATEVRS
jgi:pilus assembly protein CpaE